MDQCTGSRAADFTKEEKKYYGKNIIIQYIIQATQTLQTKQSVVWTHGCFKLEVRLEETQYFLGVKQKKKEIVRLNITTLLRDEKIWCIIIDYNRAALFH